MAKEVIAYTEYFEQACKVLTDYGALIVSLDEDGRPNPMTIGWGAIGSVWGKPVWTILVRPSRYTYGCLEHTGDFTVCVPPDSMDGVAMVCGTKSGRDMDKMADQGLTALRSETVRSPGIDECAIIYECRVVQKADCDPSTFDESILSGAYPSGDFHRIHFGEIQRVIADRAMAEAL
ncbi:MAG TPA: flavin reductase family protein [Armatimonadota bacterium]|nr:flavin reductase family protein [Armatimonadota bacterium]